MKVVLDIEANGLENPDQIWLIVCKDIDTGEFHTFRNPTSNEFVREDFKRFLSNCDLIIGHNLLDYDVPVIDRLLETKLLSSLSKLLDTLVISKLVDYSRDGHSIEDYGTEFGFEKGSFIKFTDKELFNVNSILYKQLEEYCRRDVDITHKVYDKYSRYINNPDRRRSIELEHKFQLIVNQLHDNGFAFNTEKAQKLLEKVEKELLVLDADILRAFPPKEKLIREFVPKATKFGTISKSSVPRALHDRVHEYEVGKTYKYNKLEDFNPASHKQIIEILHDAGWKPTDRTKTHIDTDRELKRLKYQKHKTPEVDLAIQTCENKLQSQSKYGWKINEHNLDTLPSSAPAAAKTLAKRILLESRRRTLTEWLGLVSENSRIHGKFYGIGAWTHRMAHQNPNTANIPNEHDISGRVKLLGREMRSLWQAPKNRLLVGVDAEGIQLRIFAHYINDKEFIDALVSGKKEDKTDPHSLNQRILGSVCKSRGAAKRFIFAYLLGAGVGKLAEILGTDASGGEEALDRLITRYAGLQELKRNVIPADAKRGWFQGLDGRAVRIPGDTVGARKHLAMSGYLQNGEAVVMKLATLKWFDRLDEYDAMLVNFVHDEWQTECPNNMSVALNIAKMQADSLREVGEELKLNCPLAGSYWNDDKKDYTIGTNWYQTH